VDLRDRAGPGPSAGDAPGPNDQMQADHPLA